MESFKSGQDIKTESCACGHNDRRRHGGRHQGGIMQRRRERKGSDNGGGRRGIVGALSGRAGDTLGGMRGRK